jgi:hypothetical protein
MKKFRYKPPSQVVVNGYVHVGNQMVDVTFIAYSAYEEDFDEVVYASGMNKGKSVGDEVITDNLDELREAADEKFKELYEHAQARYEDYCEAEYDRRHGI